jgi:hypothetical protein
MGWQNDFHGVVRRAVARALSLSEPPPAQRPSRRNTPAIVGEYFAEMAEGASAEAFRGHLLELPLLNSPPEFIEQARGAAREAEQHQQDIQSLALRFGGRPSHRSRTASRPSDLYSFALQNATEGCIRETMRAAQAAHQSQRACDEEVRRVLKKVASDSTRHASLLWEVHDWALSQLSPARGRSIRAAQQHAFSEIEQELEREVSPELCSWAGVAPRPAARRMLETLREELLQAS